MLPPSIPFGRVTSRDDIRSGIKSSKGEIGRFSGPLLSGGVSKTFSCSGGTEMAALALLVPATRALALTPPVRAVDGRFCSKPKLAATSSMDLKYWFLVRKLSQVY
jgi:hypothetical protein